MSGQFHRHSMCQPCDVLCISNWGLLCPTNYGKLTMFVFPKKFGYNCFHGVEAYLTASLDIELMIYCHSTPDYFLLH